MKRKMMVILVMAMIFGYTGSLFSQNRDVNYTARRPVIQLALLLDTSNSMDGLINQAKSQLWKIVSETGRIRQNGAVPVLQVALYEYGNDGLSGLQGYVREVLPFTTDLDELSHQLFQLSTYGGSEYCGTVIMQAVRRLSWSNERDTLKLIFIAGNEPFTQGSVNYRTACEKANKNGIIVNTIFCGDYQEGVRTDWQNGALLAGGKYFNIDNDYEYQYTRAPQDDRIAELNDRLNDTYLGYGRSGGSKAEMQQSQDSNAASLNQGSFLERAKVKSSSNYKNPEWDLVDAWASGAVDPEELTAPELPAEMRELQEDEREGYIQKKQEERQEIQAEILRLSGERDDYLRQQASLLSTSEGAAPAPALDAAVIEAITEAASEKGFDME